MRLKLYPAALEKLEAITLNKGCPSLYENDGCNGCPLAPFDNTKNSCAENAEALLKLLQTKRNK